MDIRHFITFNTVVEAEGFTKAAQLLNYGQSTVTLHIQALETHYGQLLFDRIGKKIYLTSFGQHLYEQSLAFVLSYEKLLALGEASGPNQVLRVGVYESLLHYRIQDLILAYKQACPQVDLVIRHGTCNELRDQLRTGQLDLAFQIEPLIDFTDLKSEVLTQEPFCFIFPKGRDMTLMQDKTQTVYMTEKECTYRKAFEHFLDQNGITKHQTMETGSVEVIKQYVACGLGYSFVPEITVRDSLSAERFERVPHSLETPLYTQILYHRDKQLFSAMETFLAMLRDYAANWK